MGKEIAFKNGQVSDFQGLVTLTLTGSYCMPSCISHRPLPTYQISLKSKELFVNGQMDGHFRPTLLGPLQKYSIEYLLNLIEYYKSQ